MLQKGTRGQQCKSNELFFSSVVVNLPPTRFSSSNNRVCPNCNNRGVIGIDCDNCGAIFEQDNGSATDDGSHDSSLDDEGESIVLLVSEMS